MASNESKISTRFPQEYGDCAIRSSDGVSCYFPSNILRYMSKFFDDMFSLPQPGGTYTGTAHPPLQITESLGLLELYLIHIDPKLLKPTIDVDTIEGLLEMARKYQTNAIMQWFEAEITLIRRDEVNGIYTTSLVSVDPLKVLDLAIQFDLHKSASVALKELTGCNSSRLYSKGPYRNSLPLHDILSWREERIVRYNIWIQILADNRKLGLFGSRDDSHVKGCIDCTRERALWIYGMMDAVRMAPNWSSFRVAYEADRMCSKCDLSWPVHFRRYIPLWQEEALAAEAQVPKWPI